MCIVLIFILSFEVEGPRYQHKSLLSYFFKVLSQHLTHWTSNKLLIYHMQIIISWYTCCIIISYRTPIRQWQR